MAIVVLVFARMTEEGAPEHRYAKTVVMRTIDVHFESIPQKQDCINTG